jgi:threonine/homoserine/homoserine lactone efflux protein
MPTSALVAFWGVALLLIIVPGADWAFTISAGLRGQSVVPAVGGLVLGYSAMTIVVAAGVGALVAQSAGALMVLTVLGGAYLTWHGARTTLSPATPITAETVAAVQGPRPAAWGTVAAGVGVSGLNPKGLLIFVALLPQFTDPDRSWPLALQMAALGMIFVLTCATFYLALSLLTRTVLLSRPAAARVVSRISGVGMILIGASLILERLLP